MAELTSAFAATGAAYHLAIFAVDLNQAPQAVRQCVEVVRTCFESLQKLITLRAKHLQLLEIRHPDELLQINRVIENANRGIKEVSVLVEKCRPDSEGCTSLGQRMKWVLADKKQFSFQQPMISNHHSQVIAATQEIRQIAQFHQLADCMTGSEPETKETQANTALSSRERWNSTPGLSTATVSSGPTSGDNIGYSTTSFFPTLTHAQNMPVNSVNLQQPLVSQQQPKAPTQLAHVTPTVNTSPSQEAQQIMQPMACQVSQQSTQMSPQQTAGLVAPHFSGIYSQSQFSAIGINSTIAPQPHQYQQQNTVYPQLLQQQNALVQHQEILPQNSQPYSVPNRPQSNIMNQKLKISASSPRPMGKAGEFENIHLLADLFSSDPNAGLPSPPPPYPLPHNSQGVMQTISTTSPARVAGETILAQNSGNIWVGTRLAMGGAREGSRNSELQQNMSVSQQSQIGNPPPSQQNSSLSGQQPKIGSSSMHMQEQSHQQGKPQIGGMSNFIQPLAINVQGQNAQPSSQGLTNSMVENQQSVGNATQKLVNNRQNTLRQDNPLQHNNIQTQQSIQSESGISGSGMIAEQPKSNILGSPPIYSQSVSPATQASIMQPTSQFESTTLGIGVLSQTSICKDITSHPILSREVEIQNQASSFVAPSVSTKLQQQQQPVFSTIPDYMISGQHPPGFSSTTITENAVSLLVRPPVDLSKPLPPNPIEHKQSDGTHMPDTVTRHAQVQSSVNDQPPVQQSATSLQQQDISLSLQQMNKLNINSPSHVQKSSASMAPEIVSQQIEREAPKTKSINIPTQEHGSNRNQSEIMFDQFMYFGQLPSSATRQDIKPQEKEKPQSDALQNPTASIKPQEKQEKGGSGTLQGLTVASSMPKMVSMTSAASVRVAQENDDASKTAIQPIQSRSSTTPSASPHQFRSGTIVHAATTPAVSAIETPSATPSTNISSLSESSYSEKPINNREMGYSIPTTTSSCGNINNFLHEQNSSYMASDTQSSDALIIGKNTCSSGWGPQGGHLPGSIPSLPQWGYSGWAAASGSLYQRVSGPEKCGFSPDTRGKYQNWNQFSPSGSSWYDPNGEVGGWSGQQNVENYHHTYNEANSSNNYYPNSYQEYQSYIHHQKEANQQQYPQYTSPETQKYRDMAAQEQQHHSQGLRYGTAAIIAPDPAPGVQELGVENYWACGPGGPAVEMPATDIAVVKATVEDKEDQAQESDLQRHHFKLESHQRNSTNGSSEQIYEFPENN